MGSRAPTDFGTAIGELSPEKVKRSLPLVCPRVDSRTKGKLVVSEVQIPICGHRELDCLVSKITTQCTSQREGYGSEY